MKRSAYISRDGLHRYWLRRVWDDSLSRVAFVMLNPSTADGATDDPTVRRCIGFARVWGFGGIEVVNVYNLRATQPKDLWGDADRMGTWVHDTVADHLDCCQVGAVVCAWGNHAKAADVASISYSFARFGLATACLGVNKGGAPKHPLYLAKTTALQPWALQP